MTLEVDEVGLRYSFEAPKTAWGDYIVEGIRRGDFTDCSFAFTIAEDGDHWEKDCEGNYKRTILRFDHIYDVAICAVGAYSQPQVSCRSFEDFKADEEKRNQEELEKQKEELNSYFSDLKSQIPND